MALFRKKPPPEKPATAWPATGSISEHLVRRMESAVSRLEALAARLEAEQRAEEAAMQAVQERRAQQHHEQHEGDA